MLFELVGSPSGVAVGRVYTLRPASDLGVREKAIEDWIASRPEMLFQAETLLIIGQSISGQSMADVLALDATGRLVVVEVKRDWSDRGTVGQLLEYASSLAGTTYEQLDEIARRYANWPGGSLIDRFRGFAERPDFPAEQLGQRHRIVIVAPDSDQGLRSIVAWLKNYGLPIYFVSFGIYSDPEGQPTLLSVDTVPEEQEVELQGGGWQGHWFFNTNETYGAGAWRRMFETGVAAIYGYATGPKTLEGSSAGNTILAYVSGQGLRAVGTIEDGTVRPGTGIFEDPPGQQAKDEYHLAVRWEHVLAPDDALSATQAAALGYNLPVRSVFVRLRRGDVAKQLEQALRERGAK